MPFVTLQHRILALTGRDALAFAQAQTMNDVTSLADGQWQWSGWLTPKGRVLALFALLRIDAETVWLLLPDAEPVQLAAALQRFVFRSKVAIAVRDDLQVSGSFSAPGQARGAQIAHFDANRLELDMRGDGVARTLRVDAATPESGSAADRQWAAFDLQHGLPRLSATQAEQWTPQQLSLDRLQAYSVKKGCYPGQEIVARTHFLGQAKRGLALLDVEAAEGDVVTQEGAEIGRIVCIASGSTPQALAVLPLQRSQAPLTVAGLTADESPLLSGLAR